MSLISLRRITKVLTVTGVVAATVFGSSAAAQAATTASVGCSARTTAAKFKGVDGDSSQYFTAPSGTFESTTPGWALNNSGVTSGNEPRNVNGTGGSKSLKVNAGGSAVSPIFCNQYGEPSLRFFYKGSAGARIHLHIDVTNTTSNLVSPLDWEVPVAAGGAWAATTGIMTPYLYSANNTENVQLRITAVNGSVQIDDVEVDPWKSL